MRLFCVWGFDAVSWALGFLETIWACFDGRVRSLAVILTSGG